MIPCDDAFEKEFKKLTRGLEDHQFKHFNESMGCWIYSKEHYKHEMLKRGMVPYDMAEGMAETWDSKNANKEYDELSPKAMNIIRSLKLTADKNGNIKLGGRAIKALQEIGAIGKFDDEVKEFNTHSGGFHDSKKAPIKLQQQ